MKRFVLFLAAVFYFQLSYSQDTVVTPVSQPLLSDSAAIVPQLETLVTGQESLNIYTTKFKVDAPIIVAGVGLSYLGVKIIKDKKPLTDAEAARKVKSNVPFFDRNSAGWYSEKANDDSYVPFYFSFAAPVAMMVINKNERHHIGQMLVMYTETMAITGTMFTMTAGLIHRSRPLVYGAKAPLELRKSEKSQRSFYAGHTASSAAATFFAAKVFHDLNPGSRARPFVWAIAAAVPASVGYLRYKAGMHFLSDNLLGYVLGAATGILVPELHKNKKLKNNFSLTPLIGRDYRGFSVCYNF